MDSEYYLCIHAYSRELVFCRKQFPINERVGAIHHKSLRVTEAAMTFS